ncbi:response regulator [Desulfurispira natronophila]|uniref:CheY-like chemotaxis protein n=1 Tax=Desulfurispira natronophila TaxID=682562 RepID=A0A7W7Y4N2_9BACT|nr:CheY-like chemotaxis protein [Desulfurispira natronophila]
MVDDDPAVRDMLRRSLLRSGFRVATAPSGHEALELAARLMPTAITLDVMMPQMDGWSVLSKLKANPLTRHIPVIMVTIVNEKKAGYALGASEYLVKPIDREYLVDVLEKYRPLNASECTVLIVEDEALTRATIGTILTGKGYQILEAANGEEALELMEKHNPCLILLDLIMPHMDGFAFARKLQTETRWKDIPVIILTSKDLTDEEKGSLEGQVTNILQKQAMAPENLVRQVEQFIAHRLREDK